MSRTKTRALMLRSRFARRREERATKGAAIEEQRAWWHTAWSRASAAAKVGRRTTSVRQELAERAGYELSPLSSATYGTPEWVHQHAGHPYVPYRNPARVERLRRSGRLRTDLEL